MKKIIKKFINVLGFDLKRLDPEIKTIDLDELLKIKLPENPVIFDVGGNRGQSIETNDTQWQSIATHGDQSHRW